MNLKLKILDILEQFGLSDSNESIYKSSLYADYALFSMIPLLLWMSYVQYYFPARLPWSYAISPCILFIVLFIYRVRLNILALDLESGARSKDAWKEMRNSSLSIGIFSIIQAFFFFGILGNNLDKILMTITVILSAISFINLCTCPQDKSELYSTLYSVKVPFIYKIITKFSNLMDKK